MNLMGNSWHEANILFICGAPRSGTSMLVRAFDWHPEVIMFPFEINIVSQFFSLSPEEFKKYLTTSFLSRKAGKQSIFANRDSLISLANLLETHYKYDANIIRKINTDLFREAFYTQLNQVGNFDLYSSIRALVFAFVLAIEEIREKYDRPKFIAIKIPFWIEFFGKDIAQEIPNSYFINIIRNPIDRYVSAKIRSLQNINGKLRNPLLNKVDYATAQADIHITSQYFAKLNSKNMPQRYHIVRYEQLLKDWTSNITKLCDWLGIRYTRSLEMQTLLGQSQYLPSSFGFLNKSPTLNTIQRFIGKLRYTSNPERNYLRYRLMSISEPSYLKDERFLRKLKQFMSSCYKLESDSSYQYRINWLKAPDWEQFTEDSVVSRTMQIFKNGNLNLL